MGQEYRRTATTVSLINYHFVFCSRRRKVLVKQVEVRFKELVPTYSPSDIIAKLKGATSRILRQEFKHLKHLPSLWTRSYFVSTAGNVSSETIKRYVEEQKTRG
ncbi:IS200/IS605 family transposase [Paenibacillus dendritiformis]|uniref:IS200/IS605 family transposase n=1 Tax=Paenibacillus dendritiformis TaxID=130049 RepID=UPI0036595771